MWRRGRCFQYAVADRCGGQGEGSHRKKVSKVTPAPVSKANAEHYTWGGNCDGWFLLKGSDVHVIQERMPPGAAEVAHFHRKSKQLFYVLCGELTMKFESSATTIRPGESLTIEPTAVHQAVNESGEDVEFLVVSCPPSHGDRFNPGE